jgi:hypothetical protein
VAEFGQTAVDGLELEQSEVLLGLRHVRRDVELLRACQIDDPQLHRGRLTLATTTSCSLVSGLRTSCSYLTWKMEWERELLMLAEVAEVTRF